MGCNFIRALDLSKSSKVLDMGCGTGELTKFIVDVVGRDGEVVGLDPDEARIKIAQENFKDAENLKFIVGSNVTGFPHDKDEYYDLHFSSNVFHWVLGEEKKLYVQKAYQCLKPGGRIAIESPLKTNMPLPEEFKNSIEHLNEKEYKQLLEDFGRFSDVKANISSYIMNFASFSELAAWFKASTHKELDQEKDWVKEFLARTTNTEADGRLRFEIKDARIQIVGTK